MVEVTTRTIHGRYLLKPTQELTRLFLGVVGRAQKRYGVKIHIFTALANHYHFLLSVDDAHQLSAFMRYVNSNIAREAGRIFDWRETFWGRRYQSILTTSEEAAHLARFRYILAQGVKEGLVEGVRDWPGPSCARAWMDNVPLEGVWVDRTAEYEARRRGLSFAPDTYAETVAIELSPLPCWQGLSPAEIRAQIRAMAEEIENEARCHRHEIGRRVVGRQALLRVDPHDRPRLWNKSPAPFCHAASRELRNQLKEAFNLFTAAYRQASVALRAGDRSALGRFPDGCFLPSLPYRPEAAPG